MRRLRTFRFASATAIAIAIGLGLGAASAQTPPAGPPADGAPPAGAPPGAGGPPGAPGGPGGPGGPGSGLTLEDVDIQYGPASNAHGATNPPAAAAIVGPIGTTVAASGGDAPAGITPLERDIYTTKDFYADRDLWSDPRYFRCAAPFPMEAIKGAWPVGMPLMTKDVAQEDAPWGYCDRDYPRENMVSPYTFKTAQEQYDALLAEAKSRGGPTVYTHDKPPPDWDGVYSMSGFGTGGFGFGNLTSWYAGAIPQISTYLSLLTPEYQQRFVQQSYHYAVTNSVQWPGSYCWPEGFMRRWFDPDKYVMTGAQMTQFWNHISETVMTQVMFGEDFKTDWDRPYLGQKVPQWFGDTIGFWDGEVLVTWTANVKHWIQHGAFEFSDKMQSVEIYSPITRKDNGEFIGLHHEAILYDPDALVEPVRIVTYMEKTRNLNEGAPFDWRECIQTLFPVDGFQVPANPGDTVPYVVPDMEGRPWADVWAQFEQDMPARPQAADVLSDFQ